MLYTTILPAALSMVQASQQYAFQVLYTSGGEGTRTTLPCQKILGLVRSMRSSKPEALANVWKLTTTGVEDLLEGVCPHHTPSKQYTISAICNMNNLPAYRFDPPRGGAQHALVTPSAVVGDTFIADQVQLLSADEADKARASLKALLRLAALAHAPDRKRGASWSDDFSPAVAKKCRIPPTARSRLPESIQLYVSGAHSLLVDAYEGWQRTLVPDFTTRPQRSDRKRVDEREKRFVAFKVS